MPATPRRSASSLFLLVLLALAAGLLAAPVAGAASTPTASTQIYACVKKHGGAARVVSARTKCRHSERKLSWSATGPAGANGAPGSGGARGAAGSNGANGAVAGFSAQNTAGVPLSSTAAIAVSKTVPAGSYVLAAKTVVTSTSTAAGTAVVECVLNDTPGSEAQTTSKPLDISVFAGPLGAGTPSSFAAASSLAMDATISTSATSTLAVVCGGLGFGTPTPTVAVAFSALTAIQTTQNS